MNKRLNVTSDKYKGHRTSYRWLIVILLTLLGMINFADKAIIGFAAVPIMHDLGLTHEQLGFASGAFFWLFSVSAIVIGWLSDRVNTKPMIAIIASIWSVTQFLSIAINSMAQLVATRVLLGAAEGPSYNLSLHHAEKWLLPSQRGTGFGLVSVGSPLGPALMAPPLIYIIFHYGWRLGFLLLGSIGLIWIVVWLIVAKEKPISSSEGESKINARLTRKSDRTGSDWRSLAGDLLTHNFLFTVLSVFTGYWGLMTLVVWVPAYLQEVRHISHAEATLYLGLPWLGAAAAALLIGLFSDYLYKKTRSDRISRVYVIAITGILAGIFWFLLPNNNNIGVAVGCVVLAIALGQPVFPLGGTLITATVSTRNRGAALGAMVCLMALAGLISPIIAGIFVQDAKTTQVGYENAFYLCGIITIIANILLLLVVRPKQLMSIAGKSDRERPAKEYAH